MVSTRFAAAVELLWRLAETRGLALSSYKLATYLQEDPGVVRRLVGRLRRAGLVAARSGPGGGVRLARPACRIDLAAVDRAVGPPARSEQLPGGELARTLVPALEQAERRYAEALAAVTIGDLADAVARARRRPRVATSPEPDAGGDGAALEDAYGSDATKPYHDPIASGYP